MPQTARSLVDQFISPFFLTNAFVSGINVKSWSLTLFLDFYELFNTNWNERKNTEPAINSDHKMTSPLNDPFVQTLIIHQMLKL